MTHTILLTILLAKSCGRRFPSIEHTTQAHFLGGTLSNHTTAENYLFTLEAYAQGRPLNLLCASLMDPNKRATFLADEAAYCDSYGLSPEQKQAVLDREWSEILNLGGTIFYVYKLAMVLGVSMQDLGGIFTGMSTDEFKTMLKNGGNK